MKPVEIVIRDYKSPDDDSYIYSTWTKSSWYRKKDPLYIDKQAHFKQKIKEIKNILSPDSVKIACFKDSPYVIAGYIVVANEDIAWLCIKRDFLNQGVEELLTQSMKDKINGTQRRITDKSESQEDH